MFTLKRIQIKKHKVLKDVDLCFFNDGKCPRKNIYNSVIIGPNGVGKSILLKTIVEIFSYLYHYQYYPRVNKYLPYSFMVEYQIGDDEYMAANYNPFEIMKNGRIPYIRTYCRRNGEEISIVDLMFPNKIIASTMTITDKFSSQSNDLYQYRGVRNERSQATSTRSLVRRTVEGIMDGVNTKFDFRTELGNLLEYLKLKKEMYVTYSTKYRDIFFTQDMTPNKLEDIFDNWSKYFHRETAPWGLRHFESIRKNEDNLRVISEYLVRQSEIMKREDINYISYDIFFGNQIGIDKEVIGLLSQLDILTYPTLHVRKDDKYPFQESSSGESQLLCQFIGILSSIRQESLVIIDEPENSCHPEWQMKYIDWLKEIFAKYSSCHFIIATHSPSILMNLKHDESTIIPLMRTENGIHINEESEVENTYSWQYEDLLQYTMMMSTLHTKQYDEYMTAFEDAIKEEDKEQAHNYYVKLINMMRPDDVLRELLQIKMLGML